MPDSRLGAYTFRATLDRYRKRNPALIGPFYRRRSPTQRLDHDTLQTSNGMLLGRTPRGGKGQTVQAYVGPLPAGESGIEFLTPVWPHQIGLPTNFGANWYFDDTAFTGRIYINDEPFAGIPIVVTRHVP